MSKSQKKNILLFSIVLIFIFIGGIIWSRQKLTYIEQKKFYTTSDNYIELSSTNDSLAQEFIMPYDLLNDFAIKIGTFQRDNNSTWKFFIKEKETGRIIFEKEFNASLIEDNGQYNVEIGKNIHVNKGKKYVFEVVAEDVSTISSLAFYTSNESGLNIIHNGKNENGSLCFSVYGGDTDNWWTGYIIVLFITLIILVIRICTVLSKGKRIVDDLYIQALFVTIVSFILLSTFAVSVGFTDESDNMYGGMVIANGGVLYRDYVTQHTPVAYYLCSLFALLGAGSTEQFRLSYYILEAIIWGAVYIRHVKNFGWKKMAALPVLEIICISSIVWPEGTQILSDGIQGVLFVILLLEYLVYLKNKKLDWTRCIILSICIWGSFGSAFVSAYALIWLALMVIVLELIDWKKKMVSFANVCKRYYKFVIAIIVPFISAAVYFKINGSLKRAFEQFYVFNREVYPKYVDGLGNKLIEPFVTGIQNFVSIIADNFNNIVTAKATNVQILQLIIVVLAVGFLIAMVQKKKLKEAIVLFLLMIFSATRGYGFHGLAAWYIAVMIIVLNVEIVEEKMHKLAAPLLALISIVLLSTYAINVGNNVLYEQTCVSEMESAVIDLTENLEDKDIYLDAWTSESLYYFYKDRYPVNCAVFMLPWYMDWYEKDNIYALKQRQPKVVVYSEEEEAWDYKDYSVAFVSELKNSYSRMGDDSSSWQYNVWIRNE